MKAPSACVDVEVVPAARVGGAYGVPHRRRELDAGSSTPEARRRKLDAGSSTPELFTGDWLSYEHDRGTRYEAAYAGWLLDRWHG